MTKILILIACAGVGFGFVLSALSRISIWFSVGLYAVAMFVLFLCIKYSVGYVGGNDAAGNGMERGFLNMFYVLSMTIASVGFIVSLVMWFSKYRHE